MEHRRWAIFAHPALSNGDVSPHPHSAFVARSESTSGGKRPMSEMSPDIATWLRNVRFAPISRRGRALARRPSSAAKRTFSEALMSAEYRSRK
jgi:hypothetical protein